MSSPAAHVEGNGPALPAKVLSSSSAISMSASSATVLPSSSAVSMSASSVAMSQPLSLTSFLSQEEDPENDNEKPLVPKRDRKFHLTKGDAVNFQELSDQIKSIINADDESENDWTATTDVEPRKRISRHSAGEKKDNDMRKSYALGKGSSGTNLNLLFDKSDKKKTGLFGRKIDYATMEDINLLNSQLRQEIGNNRTRITEVFEKLVSDMNGLHGICDELKQDHDLNRDSMIRATQQFTDHCIQRLKSELQKTTETLHESLESDLETARELLHELRHDIVPSLSARLDDELRRNCANFAEQAALHDRQVNEQMASQSRDFDNVASKLRRECVAMRADCDKYAEQVTRGEALQKERICLQDVRLDDMEARVTLRMEQLSESVLELARKTDELHLQARSESQRLADNLRESFDVRTTSLEETLSTFGSAVANAAGMPTRRVEWQIREASRALLASEKAESAHSRWLSPKFDAAGAQDLQMDLEFIHQNVGSGSCDVALGLWGTEGLHLVFRMYIGDHSAHMEHTFVGRSLCESKQIVSFAEALNPADDSLHVGIEIIEAIRISSRKAASVVAPVSTSFDGLFAPSPQVSRESEIPDNESNSLEGLILEHHYVNHSTLELVREQVNLMQSRMTRRVEWKLEQASILPRCFPQGESLCSSSFEAAGIQGLQLVFYPSGFDGAKEGFCSFFLSCPSGSSLRCLLHAGKQRREARLESGQPGFLGRTNFCRFENCIELVGDYVLLALEIEEAQQAITSTLSHNTAQGSIESARETPPSTIKDVTKSQTVSPLTIREAPPSRAATTEPCVRNMLPDSIDSVLRLHRAPGKTTLENVKELPSIWTPKPIANVGDVLEGFYKFSDIKGKKCQGYVRRPVASAPSGSLEGNLDDDDEARPFSFVHTGTHSSLLSSRTDRERDRSTPRKERYRKITNKFAPYA